MKINVLNLIEDALIGGRNGEMTYIYNNPFMEQIYRDWRNNKQTNNTFKDFLIECLNTEQENGNSQTVTTYKPITKRYELSGSNEKYKEYKKIQNQIDWSDYGYEYDSEVECKRLHIIPLSDEANDFYLGN